MKFSIERSSFVPKSFADSAVTPIAPFKPSTRLLSKSKANSGLCTQCLLLSALIHVIIGITLIVLYIEALIQPIFYANLLCYAEDLLGNQAPCNLQTKELMTVYSTSIIAIIHDLWCSEEIMVSILFLCASIVFPMIHIINNFRLIFEQNTAIKLQSNHKSFYSSIFFICLNKLSMIYPFGCILLYVSLCI